MDDPKRDKNQAKDQAQAFDLAEAIDRCRRGGTAEFGVVYDAYFRSIYNFIYYKTLHRETAEDLTSKTFTKALKNINDYRSEKGDFSAWLYQIARNNIRDHFRARKNDANIDDIYDLAADDDPLLDADNAVLLAQARAELAKIKPEQRETIMLRIWEGKSFREIAELSGKSEGAVKMMFSRSISQLRSALALIMLFFSSISNSL